MRTRICKIALLLLPLLICTSNSDSLAKRRTVPNERKLLTIKIAQVLEDRRRIAEQNLSEDLSSVADRLQARLTERKRRTAIGLYPDQPEEVERLERALSGSISLNPYAAVELMKDKLDSRRVTLKIDPSLNLGSLSLFRENPPVDWCDQPGKIVVLHNNYDLTVVWAAGLDGRPLRSPESGQAKIISLRLKQ